MQRFNGADNIEANCVDLSGDTKSRHSDFTSAAKLEMSETFPMRCSLWCMLPLLVSIVYAQVDRSSLGGTVTDPDGSRIPGVIATAIQPATSLERKTETSSQGTYAGMKDSPACAPNWARLKILKASARNSKPSRSVSERFLACASVLA